MLILFVATKGGSESAPTLRDLHVMDSENSTHVPVAGMDGWDDDFLQVQTLTFAPCELSSEAAFTSGTLGDTDMFWCRRLFKGLIHASFSDSGIKVGKQSSFLVARVPFPVSKVGLSSSVNTRGGKASL